MDRLDAEYPPRYGTDEGLRWLKEARSWLS